MFICLYVPLLKYVTRSSAGSYEHKIVVAAESLLLKENYNEHQIQSSDSKRIRHLTYMWHTDKAVENNIVRETLS